MKLRYESLVFLLLLVMITACRQPPDPGVATSPASEPGEGRPTPTTGSTPTTASDGYPAPPLPTPTSPPDGYPAPEAAAATPRPGAYPAAGDVIWIVRPMGEQCADPAYDSLEEAVAALEAAGVSVSASEMTSLAVCQACGCPTSEHFRAQIDAEDLDKATGLGWTPGE